MFWFIDSCRGDRAFCSVECRCRQIFMDEEETVRRDNCSLAAMKPTSASSCPSSSSPSSSTSSRLRKGTRTRAGGFAYWPGNPGGVIPVLPRLVHFVMAVIASVVLLPSMKAKNVLTLLPFSLSPRFLSGIRCFCFLACQEGIFGVLWYIWKCD